MPREYVPGYTVYGKQMYRPGGITVAPRYPAFGDKKMKLRAVKIVKARKRRVPRALTIDEYLAAEAAECSDDEGTSEKSDAASDDTGKGEQKPDAASAAAGEGEHGSKKRPAAAVKGEHCSKKPAAAKRHAAAVKGEHRDEKPAAKRLAAKQGEHCRKKPAAATMAAADDEKHDATDSDDAGLLRLIAKAKSESVTVADAAHAATSSLACEGVDLD
jgi:hypothetical protein